METLNQASLADGTVSGSVPHASYQIRVPDTDDESHYIVREYEGSSGHPASGRRRIVYLACTVYAARRSGLKDSGGWA